MKVVEQRNYSVVRLSAEIGGVIRALTLIFQFITSICMRHRFTALIGNRMYKLRDDFGEERSMVEPRFYFLQNLGCSCLIKNKLYH